MNTEFLKHPSQPYLGFVDIWDFQYYILPRTSLNERDNLL